VENEHVLFQTFNSSCSDMLMVYRSVLLQLDIPTFYLYFLLLCCFMLPFLLLANCQVIHKTLLVDTKKLLSEI
jgi:hypothetical protein